MLLRFLSILNYLVLLLPLSGLGQTGSLRSTSSMLANETYHTSLGGQLHLYNGVRYREHAAKSTDRGIPYFGAGVWTKAEIVYDGETFTEVPLLYDVVHDKVIIQHGTGGLKIELIDQKLISFSIPGHQFIHLNEDSLKGTVIQTGYFELVVSGKVRFWTRWHRELLDYIEDREIKSVFMDRHSYYLSKGNNFTTVSSMAEVIRVLGDKKNLKKFIRKNKVRFRRDKVSAIARVVEYHNQGNP